MLKKLLKKYFAVLLASCAFAVPSYAWGAQTVNPKQLPDEHIEVTAQLKKSGPVLLYSDSPEMVRGNGILYRDTVSGSVRIFLHHVNAMKGNRKIAVVVRNISSMHPVKCEVTRRGLGKSAWNYMEEGKNSQRMYFAALGKGETKSIGFGRNVELITGRGFILEPGKLLSGAIDIYLDRPAEISVLMCDARNSLDLFTENASVLPPDEYLLRGTFENADWHYTIKEPIMMKDGEVMMMHLAGADEGYAKGTDATTGREAEDRGNYGILYTVSFKVEGKRPVRMVLNSLAGEFAGWAVLEKEGGERMPVAIPGHRISTAGYYYEMSEIGVLEAGNYNFIWSPPGSSNLPIRLYWENADTYIWKKS